VRRGRQGLQLPAHPLLASPPFDPRGDSATQRPAAGRWAPPFRPEALPAALHHRAVGGLAQGVPPPVHTVREAGRELHRDDSGRFHRTLSACGVLRQSLAPRGRLVACAREHREPRVLLEARIGRGQLAQPVGRARGGHAARVAAGEAQAHAGVSLGAPRAPIRASGMHAPSIREGAARRPPGAGGPQGARTMRYAFLPA